MGNCTPRSRADVKHVEHVAGEAESVAELLDDDAAPDEPERLRLPVRERDVDKIRKVQKPNHLPQPRAQTVAGNEPSGDDASRKHGDDTESAVQQAEDAIIHSEPAAFCRIFKKERRNYADLNFSEAEKQKEKEQKRDAFFFEKCFPCIKKIRYEGGFFRSRGNVCTRAGKNQRVNQRKRTGKCGNTEQNLRPSRFGTCSACNQESGCGDDSAFGEDLG